MRIDKDFQAIVEGKYFGEGLIKIYMNMLMSLIDIKSDKIFAKTGKKHKKKVLIL